ncbi:MAG TPA: T9SS type A sorting domain-containing protein, partial [Candidatus Kapabacteria bacterium]|nr:T9SS type A sorting domain-containing protein [Candidatus Kapabacteria bacterium]
NKAIISLSSNILDIYAITLENEIYLSTDNGDSWTQQYIFASKIKNFICDENNIYVATDLNGIYKSSDNGQTWQNIGLMDKYINNLCLYKGNIIASTGNAGIYLSKDDGINWTQICIDTFSISKLLIDGDYLFAYNDITGLYQTTLEDIGLDVKENNLLFNEPPYPNPAEDFIIIKDHIGYNYQIYNMLGNCVQSGIINSEKINITSLPMGFYALRIYRDNMQIIEKIIKR